MARAGFGSRRACETLIAEGRVTVEGRIPKEMIAELERRGHEVIRTGDWVNGKVMGIRYDQAREVILGAVSPRGNIGYAFGW